MNNRNYDDYLDRSDDLIARVRKAKEAAQRKMEEFGDPSEYEITTFRGHGPNKASSESAQDSAEPQPIFRFLTPETNPQKKSPRNSVKNERTDVGPEFTTPNGTAATRDEED
jgi:hypothetical protein